MTTPSSDKAMTLRFDIEAELPGVPKLNAKTSAVPAAARSPSKVAKKLMLPVRRTKMLASALQRRGVQIEVWQINRGFFYSDRCIGKVYIPLSYLIENSMWEGPIPIFGPEDDA